MGKTATRRHLSLAAEHEPAAKADLSPVSALRVARARRLLEAGFYDQPEVLDEAMDRMMDRARRERTAATRQIA